jgi:hypothetical protein
MHAIPWYIALLISVPQTILIIEFGFRLFNIQLKTRDILFLSFVIAVFCYFLRELPIPYVVNTLILIALLSLCSAFICRINLRYCFIPVVLGLMIYGVLESLLLPLMLKVLRLSFNELIVDPWFNLIAFVPILIIAVLLLWYIIKKDFVLYDFGSEEKFMKLQLIIAQL